MLINNCKPIAINDATSQYGRMLKAMSAGYVNVDERTFEDLLEFAIDFTGLVYYYNLKDEIAGDWTPFFISDEAMVYVSMMNMDLSRLEAKYLETENKAKQCLPPREKFYMFKELFCWAIYSARKINLWLKGLNFISPGQRDLPVEKEIGNSISGGLSNELRTLRSYDEGAGLKNALGHTIGLYYGDFLPLWNIKNVSPNGCIYSGYTLCDKINHAIPYLRPVFYEFYYELARIQKSVKDDFQASLAKPDHKPQIALYLAFVKLFHEAQKSINTYTPRYRDFYYHKILRESLRKYFPDSVFLTFKLEEDDGLNYAKVGNGALFVAGQDENEEDILYAADKDLFVNKSEITKLHTLYQDMGPLFEELKSPKPLAPAGCQNNGENEKVLKRVLGADILPPSFEQEETPVEESAQVQPQAFPTFGGGRVLDLENYKNGDTLMGFAFSSHNLFLGQGARNLSFLFHINKKSGETLKGYLKKLSAETGLDNKKIFIKLLGPLLDIFYSSEEGWEPVNEEDVNVCVDLDKDVFLVKFSLPPLAPAITNFNPGADDEEFDPEAFAEESENPGVYLSNPNPNLPTVKFYFTNPKIKINKKGAKGFINVYPLSLFNGLEIDMVKIKTGVTGLLPTFLSNNSGEIDPSAPFNPFAPVPSVGSYLLIGNDEIFQKPLESLQVNLEWFNLPQNSDGFEGYYRYYKKGLDGKIINPVIDNTVFKGKISVLNPGPWDLKPPSKKFCLFRTENTAGSGCAPPPPTPDGKLCQNASFKLDVINSTTGNPPYYSPQDSFIKLELAQPPYAFGDSVYSINVMDAVLKELEAFTSGIITLEQPNGMEKVTFESDSTGSGTISFENSASGSGETTLEYPSQPYTPTIQSLSLDYTSSWFVSFASGAISFTNTKEKEQEDTPVFYNLYPFGGYKAVNSQITTSLKNTNEKPPNQGYTIFPLAPLKDPLVIQTKTPTPDYGYPVLLLPQFRFQGNLIMGFSNMAAPQTLTLLFRFEENSAEVFQENPPFICWSYLEQNNWLCLAPSQVLSDTTLGFQKSGIVTLNIPSFSIKENTILPDNVHWLRASVKEEAENYPKTINIWPQAVTATWQDNDNTGRHLKRPLPALSIDTPLNDLPGIETILQPMDSFNGRPKETPNKMFLRIGERLRHKKRAILPWDYERLVLERFPTIYKVKCLPCRDPFQGEEPGSVLVVVTPGPDNMDALNPLTPMAGGSMLKNIHSYLLERVSPFIKLYVVNPVYCQIEVDATIQFVEGDDVGLCVDRLNSDLVKYLSPWFYDQEREEKAGSYFFESDISSFIQTRPYVDYLDSLALSYDPGLKPCEDAWYFFTSAKKHKLTIVGEDYECV